jgi:hypothetical protein
VKRNSGKVSVFRLAGLLGVFLSLILVSACVSMGPPGAQGVAAVKSDPVQSSDGLVKVENPRGDSFFIKWQDQTNPPKGINLRNNLTQLLLLQGKREARSSKEAYYLIDMIAQNFESGKKGTIYGTDESRAAAIARDDAGELLIGELIGSGFPNYCKFEVDLVIDELNPSPIQETQDTGKKTGKTGKKTEPKAEKNNGSGESIQTKTVLTGSAEYMAHQATETDATNVISENMARFIADMFR